MGEKMKEVADVKIERGVPMPPSVWNKYGQWREAFLAMKIGDSIHVPCDRAGLHNMQMRWYQLAWRYGYSITTRRDDAGLRVWLVSKERRNGRPPR